MDHKSLEIYLAGESKLPGPRLTTAMRAAEMAYRRGFYQGVYAALAHLREGGSLADLEGWEQQLWAWRDKGRAEGHRRAVWPPRPAPVRGRQQEVANHA